MTKLAASSTSVWKRECQRVNPRGPAPMDGGKKGPEDLGEILSRLFTARGWGRRQDRLRLERAWAEGAGPEVAAATRPGAVRRGGLEVTVASPVLLQELTHLHKRRLLPQPRERLPGT